MSTRASLSPECIPARGRCSICGDADWRALWSCAHDILICPRCAVEVLPRIIADATYRPNRHVSDAAAILDKVRAEYWRAVAICEMRDGRKSA